MSENVPVVGQRWLSETEPELGLAVVREFREGQLQLWFPEARQRRTYAWPGAPVRRKNFVIGEMVQVQGDAEYSAITAVRPAGDLHEISLGGAWWAESQVRGWLPPAGPWEQCGAGQFGEGEWFPLRLEALFRRATWQRAVARGFVGGRVALIPHQLAVAEEISRRWRPRVLLADEVGLGKTIEACLILHRLVRAGRVTRVLILVPESLVHQWFVELLRRFQLSFSIFDEARCEAIELHQDEATNPFLDSQWVLASADWLLADERRCSQAAVAGWELAILDEAHRFPVSNSMELLLGGVPGLMLLTATPLQSGWEEHWQRLRLLDADRYPDFPTFLNEMARYETLVAEVQALLQQGKLLSDQSVKSALDQAGLGRVMFRQVRAGMVGFPGRRLHRIEIPEDTIHARISWLAEWLRAHPQEKMLVIGRTRELAESALELLLREIQVSAGVFHEGQTLLQRDRQAAWFADHLGARVLFASEIGSEGRNFQFTSHLLLLDLPGHPDLLEQRIGRLDRIGQLGEVQVYVPVQGESSLAVWLDWFEQGVGSFVQPVAEAHLLAAEFADSLAAAMASGDRSRVKEIISETAKRRVELAAAAERGVAQLLRWQAGALRNAEVLVEKIQQADGDRAVEKFCWKLLERIGMQLEELESRLWLLRPGNAHSESLPGMDGEGLLATFDRALALQREEVQFLSLEHPLIRGAIDWLLGGDAGKVSCVCPRQWSGKLSMLWWEAIYVLEVVAPAEWEIDRYLPAQPIRVVMDLRGEDAAQVRELLEPRWMDAPPVHRLAAVNLIKEAGLVELGLARAQAQARPWVQKAQQRRVRLLEGEWERLKELQQLHRQVPESEVATLAELNFQIRERLETAQLRLDSVRILLG
jgi:ATP-dependent helicase HepA